MLFCDQIDNYEDFKARFGFKTGVDGRCLVNANGVKQRKNNIIFLYWKEECIFLHSNGGYSLQESYRRAAKYDSPKDVFVSMLYQVFGTDLSDICPVRSFGKYQLLNSGICIDGDVNAVRYKRTDTGHTYKMKIGKFVNKYIEENAGKMPYWLKNPTLRIFFIEEITELWKNKRLKDQSLKVIVNKDFHAIYDRDRRPEGAQNFDSCMDGDNNWNYYADHEDLYDAVSLQDDEGMIYARAILVHCFDKNDNPHNYLERIYCNQRMYKDLLFEKAKVEGLFDLYKDLNASCHESTAINDVATDRKISYRLYIPIHLETGDYMSYQDTFKWYYTEVDKAYNYDMDLCSRCYNLDTTEETLDFDD